MHSYQLPRTRLSRRGGLGPGLLILLLLSALFSGLLTSVSAVLAPADAASVPRSECARYDKGVRTGVCVRDPRGGIYWLGTIAGYDGREIYCIDYGYATAWNVAHQTTTVSGGLTTSLGGTVNEPTMAALNYLVSKHPAGSINATTAAAVELVIRQVMGDAHNNGHGIPGGLTAGTSVKNVGFVPDGVVTRARDLWADAVAHRGPWTLSVTLHAGSANRASVDEALTAEVRGRNGSGRPQNMTVSLSYTGLSGPASVVLGSDGVATVSLKASSSAGRASITAKNSAAPSGKLALIVPKQWGKNPHRGRSSRFSQRGLIANQPKASVSASDAIDVVKRQPGLVTQVSVQKVEPGAKIHDSVRVSGTNGADGTFTWVLLGPVAPRSDRSCPTAGAAVWSDAKPLAIGSVATTGDGVYTTAPYTVRPADVGCLTYVESRPETSTTLPVETQPGVPAETALVTRPRLTPCASTVVSKQTGTVGSKLHDRIKIGCIEKADKVTIAWTLHGPVSPRPGVSGKAGCNQIGAGTWRKAPVAAHGTITTTGSGEVTTAAFTVRRPGCYTYSESVAATSTTKPTHTEPGLSIETAMITRPGSGVSTPDVPTGPFRTTAARTGGGRLRIPSLDIAVPVNGVGLNGRAMAVPNDPHRLGWLRTTAVAGDLIGSSVVAGHVSDSRDRPGPMARLGKVKKGAVITWVDSSGHAHRYAVSSVSRYSRSRGLPAPVFRLDGSPVLRVITCAHRVRVSGGGYHYTDNLVVTGRLLR